MTPTRYIGGQTSPEQKRRLEAAERLADLMQSREMSRKQLIHALSEYGADVSPQLLSVWLRGKWLPSDRNQAALAAVFGVPVHFIFPPVQVEKAS